MRERGDEARSSFRTVLILVAIPLVGMAVFFLWQWLNGGITPQETVQEVRGAKSAIVSKPRLETTEADALPRVTPKRSRRSTADRRQPTAEPRYSKLQSLDWLSGYP